MSDFSPSGPLVAALSALGGALVALLAAGVRVGALTQRLAVVETRQSDESAKCERDRVTTSAREGRWSLYEHRVQQVEILAHEVRSSIVAVERRVEAMQLAQTEHASTLDGTREWVERVESAIGRMDRKLDRLLGLNDTPPHGIAQTRD